MERFHQRSKTLQFEFFKLKFILWSLQICEIHDLGILKPQLGNTLGVHQKDKL
jgi:hypothetical protein